MTTRVIFKIHGEDKSLPPYGRERRKEKGNRQRRKKLKKKKKGTYTSKGRTTLKQLDDPGPIGLKNM